MSFNIKLAVKYSLFLLNVIFVIAGLVVLGVGAYLKTRDVPESFRELWSTLTIWAIVAGAVVCAVAFVGCSGAILENKIMLYLYTAVIIVLAIAQTVMIIQIFGKRSEINNNLPLYDLYKEKIQQFLYIFELVIAGLGMLIVFCQILAAVAACYLGYAQRPSKIIQVA